MRNTAWRIVSEDPTSVLTRWFPADYPIPPPIMSNWLGRVLVTKTRPDVVLLTV